MRVDEICFVTWRSCSLAGRVPVAAHHAFGGEFDPNRPCCSRARSTKLEWVNPHAWIHIEVDRGPTARKEVLDGRRRHAEHAAAPRHHEGIVEAVGTELVVDGYQARDHR